MSTAAYYSMRRAAAQRRRAQHAGAAVRCADSRSFKIKHDGVIAFTLQVLYNVGSGNPQDSRYILTDNPTRRKFSDNSKHFWP